MITTHTHDVSTRGQGDAQDLTTIVANAVAGSTLTTGVATIFVVGSTAGVTTLEFQSGVVHDLEKLMLGTWQQIVLAGLDTQPRQRQIVIQLVGD